MTTDDIRRQQAEEAVEQMIKRRRLANEKLKVILQPSTVVTPRSNAKLTTPKDFKLTTSGRKNRVRSAKSFDTMSDGAYSDSEGEYVPIAERLRAFERTPGRFRSQPKTSGNSECWSDTPSATSRRCVTSPKEFCFRVDSRALTRPTHVKSAKEIEEEEIAEIKKHQFRARPLDRRVLESRGDLGVPRVTKPELTEPRAFHFRSEIRAEIRNAHSGNETDSDASHEFKARKFPRRMFEQGPALGQRSSSSLSLTEARSPKLATAKRAIARPEGRPEESPKHFKVSFV